MKRLCTAFALASALFPLLALASTIPAGFAPGSLWLSTKTAVAGDSVRVYTVIYNSTASPLAGDVEFDVDATPLQTVHFSLAAGQTQVVSAAWTAIAGPHSFSATLEHVGGLDQTLSQVTSDTASIEVAQAPPSPIARYTNVINNVIASSSPVVQAIASTTESFRLAGVNALSAALDEATSSAPSGSASATEAYQAPSTGAGGASPAGIFATVWRFILRALLYVFQIQVLFYAALLLTVYILYKLLRTFLSEFFYGRINRR